MTASVFFELKMVEGAKLTAFQRELLGMTLEANPGIALGPALEDVFSFLKLKVKAAKLEAICLRLIKENERPEEGAAGAEAKGSKSTFGDSLIRWISEMHSADRLLAATGYNVEATRRIYCEEDYAVTDRICKLWLEDRWQASLVQLEAAAAPWGGGGEKRADEVYDLSNAADDDPQWAELAKMF